MQNNLHVKIKNIVIVAVLAVAMLVSGAVPFAAVANADDVYDVTVDRYYGSTRYDTSIEAANELKAVLGGKAFKAIVVACGDNYPDALAGGYLATVKGGPLLIVTSTVEDKIKSYIDSNIEDGGTIYILGGTGVVSSGFENKLKGLGRDITVKRLGGPTRYETNLEILKEARDSRLTERDNYKEILEDVDEHLDALDNVLATYKSEFNKLSEENKAAEEYKNSTAHNLADADRQLNDLGVDVKALRENVEAAENKVKEQEKKWTDDKVAADKAVQSTLVIKNNVGWYFLNSKATTSIEYWRTKARAYSGTKTAASSSLFNQALDNAVSYDNLVIASQQIDKSNSVSGKSRKIDYNLMTSGAVSVAVYSANHGLAHTYAYKVIDPYYGSWSGENLAYGYSTSKVWDVWYYNERAGNGPHFKQLNDSWGAQPYTGYGYSTKGSPSPSHAQEFGRGSAASPCTPAQFRTDLANYRNAANANYNAAVAKQNELKSEPAALVQAKKELEDATLECETVGAAIGIDYWDVLERKEIAEAEYDSVHEAYLAAEKKYEDAAIERDRYQKIVDETTPKYEQAAKVCEDAGLHDEDILVCDAFGFADSLSASAAGKPVLLVGKELSATQVKYLDKYDSSNIYIIGGTGAVNSAVENKLRESFEEKNISRLAGATRYATSVEVAKALFPANCSSIVLAYGMNFPDGLSGGPLAAAMGAPLILASDDNIQYAAGYAMGASTSRLVVLGGPSLISAGALSVITGQND